MLNKKLFRTLRLYRPQFISMIIMIALGIGVFVGFNMEWVSIETNTSSFFDATNFADYRVISETGMTEENVKLISKISGVDAASRYFAANADISEYKGKTVSLTVTENFKVSGFMVREGEEYDETSKDGIWLSDQFANANGIKNGDKLTLSYSGIEFAGTVKGLIKSSEYMICVVDETQVMPDYEKFGFAYISPAMYEKCAPIAFYPQINVISSLDKKEFTEKAEEAIGKTSLVITKDDTISYAEAMGEENEGKTMGSILPVVFLMIAVLTMVTTMHRLTVKEKVQIGTFKALGFKDKKIRRHYTSYAFFVGVTGSAVGIGIGYGLAWYIMNPNGAMGTYIDLPEWKLPMPWFCIVIIAAVILILTLIGYLSVKEMLKGNAADALRSYTPKKVKHMAVEKSKLFHKLSFGVRWNLRDTVRHKSRTAMSFIGVVGCTVLIIASFGMKDTMDAFIDTYYTQATAYSSKIYLNDEATRQERDGIIKKYNGDWSASVSVQFKDKAVSLDIYNIENGLIKFPDENDSYVGLDDSGAYLCMRLKREFNISKGDKIIISPYGSDDKYEIKVAGFIRSLTESIVITPEYAKSIGINYKSDSVYTRTLKEDIISDAAIKNIQTKESIVDSFDTFMEIMNSMVFLLILAAVILGVVVLYNLGVMNYTERYREMATLKVVGFRDKKIARILTGQNIWISLIGIAAGIPAGIILLDYLIVALAGEYELKLVVYPLTYIISTVMSLSVSLLVSFFVARKNKKIDMVEALKGTE